MYILHKQTNACMSRLNDSVITDTDDVAGFDDATNSPKKPRMSRKQLSSRVHVTNNAWGEDSRLGQGETLLRKLFNFFVMYVCIYICGLPTDLNLMIA